MSHWNNQINFIPPPLKQQDQKQKQGRSDAFSFFNAGGGNGNQMKSHQPQYQSQYSLPHQSLQKPSPQLNLPPVIQPSNAKATRTNVHSKYLPPPSLPPPSVSPPSISKKLSSPWRTTVQNSVAPEQNHSAVLPPSAASNFFSMNNDSATKSFFQSGRNYEPPQNNLPNSSVPPRQQVSTVQNSTPASTAFSKSKPQQHLASPPSASTYFGRSTTEMPLTQMNSSPSPPKLTIPHSDSAQTTSSFFGSVQAQSTQQSGTSFSPPSRQEPAVNSHPPLLQQSPTSFPPPHKPSQQRANFPPPFQQQGEDNFSPPAQQSTTNISAPPQHSRNFPPPRQQAAANFPPPQQPNPNFPPPPQHQPPVNSHGHPLHQQQPYPPPINAPPLPQYFENKNDYSSSSFFGNVHQKANETSISIAPSQQFFEQKTDGTSNFFENSQEQPPSSRPIPHQYSTDQVKDQAPSTFFENSQQQRSLLIANPPSQLTEENISSNLSGKASNISQPQQPSSQHSSAVPPVQQAVSEPRNEQVISTLADSTENVVTPHQLAAEIKLESNLKQSHPITSSSHSAPLQDSLSKQELSLQQPCSSSQPNSISIDSVLMSSNEQKIDSISIPQDEISPDKQEIMFKAEKAELIEASKEETDKPTQYQATLLKKGSSPPPVDQHSSTHHVDLSIRQPPMKRETFTSKLMKELPLPTPPSSSTSNKPPKSWDSFNIQAPPVSTSKPPPKSFKTFRTNFDLPLPPPSFKANSKTSNAKFQKPLFKVPTFTSAPASKRSTRRSPLVTTGNIENVNLKKEFTPIASNESHIEQKVEIQTPTEPLGKAITEQPELSTLVAEESTDSNENKSDISHIQTSEIENIAPNHVAQTQEEPKQDLLPRDIHTSSENTSSKQNIDMNPGLVANSTFTEKLVKDEQCKNDVKDELELSSKENNVKTATCLPEGWKELYTDENKPYYYHEESGKTAWEKPGVEVKSIVEDDFAESAPSTSVDVVIKETKADESEPPSSLLLPEGWKQLYTDDDKPYYLHEESGVTSWEIPKKSNDEMSASPKAEPEKPSQLPEGWKVLITNDNKTYYFHEESGETSWEIPLLNVGIKKSDEIDKQKELCSLPAGWKKLYGDDGKPYFFNEESGETSWVEPTMNSLEETDEALKTVTKHEKSSSQELASDDGKLYDFHDKKGQVSSEIPNESESEIIVPLTGENEEEVNIVLPDGWKKLETDDEKPYYFHEESGETSWEFPNINEDRKIESLSALKQEEKISTILPIGWKQLLTDDNKPYYYHEESGATSWEIPQDIDVSKNDELPEGWIELYNDELKKPYYFHTELHTTSWEKPVAELFSKEANMNDNTTEEQVSNDANFRMEQLQVNGTIDTDAEDLTETLHPLEIKKDSTGEQGTGQTELLQGWIECFTEENELYYYNAEQNLTSWTLPFEQQENILETNLNTDNVMKDTKVCAKVKEASNDESNEIEQHNNFISEEISSNETTADETKADLAMKDPVPIKNQFEEVMQASDMNSEKSELDSINQTEKTDVANLVISDSKNDDFFEHKSQTEMSGNERNDKSLSGLPSGWIECRDEQTDTSYYYHEESQTTTWVKPGISSSSTCANALQAACNSEDVYTDLSVKNSPNNEKQSNQDTNILPRGWVELIDEASGTPYFYNEQNQVTSWDYPSAIKETNILQKSINDDLDSSDTNNLQNSLSSPIKKESLTDNKHSDIQVASLKTNSEMDDSDVLPQGWVKLIDETSCRVYFFNEEQGITTWERPGMKRVDKNDTLNNENSESIEVVNDDSKLQDGWVEYIEESSGEKYYFNAEKQETTWEKPTKTVENSLSNTDQHGNELQGNQLVEKVLEDEVVLSHNNKLHVTQEVSEGISNSRVDHCQTNNDELNDVNVSPSEFHENTDQPTLPVSFKDTDKPEMPKKLNLPKHWIETIDQQSGDKYYFNEVSGETSWELPVEEKDKDDKRNDGWVEIFDEASKMIYYFNEKTKKTSWEKPKGLNEDIITSSTDERHVSISHLEQTQTDLNSQEVKFYRPKSSSLISFGFGGKLVIVKPKLVSSSRPDKSNSYKRDQVTIHKICHFLKKDPIKHRNLVGPLVLLQNKQVEKFTKSRDEILWKLIFIAISCKGRLRSSKFVAENSSQSNVSPERLIVELLLSSCNSNIKSSKNTNESSSHPVVPITTCSIEDYLQKGQREAAIKQALEGKQYAWAILIASLYPKTSEIYQSTMKTFAKDILCLSDDSSLSTFIFLLLQNNSSQLSFNTPLHSDDHWKKHLAMLVSNRYYSASKQSWESLVLSLGNTLQENGERIASHFCYMVGGFPLGSLPNYLLLGSEVDSTSNFSEREIDAFLLTEAFEYARRCGNPNAVIPSLLPFKLSFVSFLAEYGYLELARSYLKSVVVCSEDQIRSPDFKEKFEALQDRICVALSCPVLLVLDGKRVVVPAVINSFSKPVSAPIPDKIPSDWNAGANTKSDKTGGTLKSETFIGGVKTADKMTLNQLQNQPKNYPDSVEPIRVPPVNKNITLTNEDRTKKSELETTPMEKPQNPEMKSAQSTSESKKASSDKATSSSAPSSFNSSRKKESKQEAAPAPAPRSWRRFFGLPQKVDLGHSNEAYYDKKLKRWIFPGDDLDEISKPLPPPPMAVTNNTNGQKEEKKADDPLSMLMAPPQRGKPIRGKKTNSSAPPPIGMMGPPDSDTSKMKMFQPKAS